MALFTFTAKILRKKVGYGYDISGEVFDSTSKAKEENNTQKNINDTAQPQNQHQTPRNISNMTMDTEAVEEFPDELEGREPIQKYLPVRQK